MAPPERSEEGLPARLIERRIEKSGLRTRVAAGIIATVWLVAIVLFGTLQHLVDSTRFETVWDGMWWATQTVTTVGYGDLVPDDWAGKLIASTLMIGGLSLFAVITVTITSTFVARARSDTRSQTDDTILARLAEMEGELSATRADLKRLAGLLEQGPPGP